MDSIILDLDGTIANCNHRLHLLENKEWKEFFKQSKFDTVIEPVYKIINQLNNNYKIVILTSRPQFNHDITIDWLTKNNIDFDALYMRKLGDFRASPIVKSELIDKIKSDGYNPIYAFEDRLDCIEAFNTKGIFTFKVWDEVSA